MWHNPWFSLLIDSPCFFEDGEILPDRLKKDLTYDDDSFHMSAWFDEYACFSHSVVSLLAHFEGLFKWILYFVDEGIDLLGMLSKDDIEMSDQ